MLTTERKQEIVNKFGGTAKNSGSVEVQVALLTERINGLMGHFKLHKHDYGSNRGLLKMVGQRKRLLKYLSSTSDDRYKGLIKELGLRK
jgi:small subunit ribosomal protein S15